MTKKEAQVLFRGVTCPYCNEGIYIPMDYPESEFIGLVKAVPYRTPQCDVWEQEINQAFRYSSSSDHAFRKFLLLLEGYKKPNHQG